MTVLTVTPDSPTTPARPHPPRLAETDPAAASRPAGAAGNTEDTNTTGGSATTATERSRPPAEDTTTTRPARTTATTASAEPARSAGNPDDTGTSPTTEPATGPAGSGTTGSAGDAATATTAPAPLTAVTGDAGTAGDAAAATPTRTTRSAGSAGSAGSRGTIDGVRTAGAAAAGGTATTAWTAGTAGTPAATPWNAAGTWNTAGTWDTAGTWNAAGTWNTTDTAGPAGPADAGDAEDAADAEESSPVVADLIRLLFNGDDHDRIHAPWRDMISGESFRHREGLSPEQQTALAYERLHTLNRTLTSPEDLARDPERLASLHEWAAITHGGGSLCTLASIHYNLFLGSLLDHNDGPERDLTPYTTLQRTGTFLCTELAHGNDAGNLQTTATLNPQTGGFTLHTPHPGAQKFMPNTSTTGGPKTAVVAARLLINNTDHGVYLFLTPLTDSHGTLPHIRVHRLPHRPGAPVDHCLTSFDHLPLPRTALLQAHHGRLTDDNTFHSPLGNRRKRFLTSINRVTTGKLCMSAAAVGATRAALTIAVRYSHHRHITGPRPGQHTPLHAHRTHHARLITALATAYAMTLLHRTVTHQHTHPTPDHPHTERLIAITKAWITWQARTLTTEARERCGAHALFSVNALADFPHYTEGTITAEGDNLVIWTKAAAEMIFNHTTTPTPPHPHDLTDNTHLRNLLTHAEHLWQTRARHALRTTPTNDPLTRFNTASTPALRMVETHAQLQAANAFLTTINHTTNPTTRHLLTHLCRLFLLTQLTPHTTDLLTTGHLTPHQTQTLHTLHDHTIHTLTPHTTTLTNAFHLPTPYLTHIPLTHPHHLTHFNHHITTHQP
ncbi:acyl-CoA dehydrogenase [Streptomyces sp. NPDC086843]|uniref:acyl-CoA dehydrogenase family protein n=1 Tax=Streptomyces sp. NPDC086843 TaxID=3365763 RepID=UPI003829F8FD